MDRKLVDENWENHREYRKMEPGYAKCFRKNMDDLFRIMEIHSIHTTLHAMQVFLEHGLREKREEAFFNLDEETAPDSATLVRLRSKIEGE
jgi:hypothetical protein